MKPTEKQIQEAKRQERAAARRRRTAAEAHARASALLDAAREALNAGPGTTAGMPTHLWLRSLAAREVTGSTSEAGLPSVTDPSGLRTLPGGTNVCTADLRLLTVHHMNGKADLLDIHVSPMHVDPLSYTYPLAVWE